MLGTALLVLAAPAAGAQCVGDCNGSDSVEINELIAGVSIALGNAAVSVCPSFDADGSGTVTVAELITAVSNALDGCPPAPTATATATAQPSATDTAIEPTPTATDTAPPTATITTQPEATATHTAEATATTAATPTDTAAPTATETGAATPSATTTATATETAATPATPTTTTTAAETTTFTPTATFTVTPSPTMGPSGVCGNGFLEPGESCESCAMDCTIGACTATATMVTFQIDFAGPPGTAPTTVTTLLGYRSDQVSIPGSGSVTSVRQRVTFPAPLPNTVAINDLDYAVRVVLGRTAGLAEGLLYSAKFDTCQGAAAVTADDFGCTVEACAGAGGPIEGCTCTVVQP